MPEGMVDLRYPAAVWLMRGEAEGFALDALVAPPRVQSAQMGGCDRPHRPISKRCTQVACYTLQPGSLSHQKCRGEIILTQVNTARLVCHRAGVGEPLVLLHGIGESAVGVAPGAGSPQLRV
jgi:hypothetical protein